MPYAREKQIGQFAGLGQGHSQLDLWLVTANSLKVRLDKITPLSAWSTYRALEKEFLILPQMAGSIEDEFLRNVVRSKLSNTVVALPGWHARVPKWGKNKFAGKLSESLTNVINIAEGRVEILTRPVPGETEVIEKEKIVYVTVPAEPGPAAPAKEREGVPTTALLIGIGALAAGWMFLRKK